MKDNLTKRASLTFVSRALEQLSRFIINFFVTPIIIRTLGAELYGVWTMIPQAIGYFANSDLRPLGTLKYTLASQQHNTDINGMRRQIGASILLWAYTFPFFVAVGVGLIWATPYIIHTTHENTRTIQLAMAIMVGGTVLDKILSLPLIILRGMNLEYKAMGLNTITVILVGLFTVIVLWFGWGLIGVALASIFCIVINSIVRFIVARKALPWIGIAKPKKPEFTEFTKRSLWLFILGLGELMLYRSDLLFVGIILGPSKAAIYATTGTALRLLMGPVEQFASSSASGIAGLCGQKNWYRINSVRNEISIIAIVCMAIVGTGVLVLNKYFLTLWVGEEYYGGNLLNLLLVLIAFETILFRVDSIILDGLLVFRNRSIVTISSGIITLILGGLLTYLFGLVGMAIGVFFGRLFLLIYFPILIKWHGHISMNQYSWSIMRPFSVACVLLLGGYMLFYVIQPLHPQTWLMFLTLTIILFFITASFILTVGLGRSERNFLTKRITVILDSKHL